MIVDYQEIVTVESGKRSGKPCVRGMRITVYDVLSYLAAGMSHEQIRDDFPELTEEDILACLGYAAAREQRTLVSPHEYVLPKHHTVLIAIAAIFLSFASNVLAQSPAMDSPKPMPDEFERLVDALANHNEPPRLENDDGKPCAPLFSKNYNWDEQSRVSEALHILAKRRGEELWPHIVGHLDDERYSLTCDMNGDARNLTIRTICRRIVKQDLAQPFVDLWAKEYRFPYREEYVIRFACRCTVEEWRRSWKGKRLWELQVELGERGIQRMEGRDTSVKPKRQAMQMGPISERRKGIMQIPGMPGLGPAEMSVKMKEQEPQQIGELPEENMRLGLGPHVMQGQERAEWEKRKAELICKTKAIIEGIRQTKKPIVNNKSNLGPYGEGAIPFRE